MVAKIIIWILKWICFTVAILWLGLIAFAQYNCSIIPSVVGHECGGGEGDIWLLPVFYGQIGLPAFIASILIIIVPKILRNFRL
jgi:hypothetical protein